MPLLSPLSQETCASGSAGRRRQRFNRKKKPPRRASGAVARALAGAIAFHPRPAYLESLTRCAEAKRR